MKSSLSQLQIDPAMKRRPRLLVAAIFASVTVALIVTVYLGWPKEEDGRRVAGNDPYAGKGKGNAPESGGGAAVAPADKLVAGREAASATETRGVPERSERPSSAAEKGQKSGSSGGAVPGRDRTDGPKLVVSGYIVARERIEISPRFQGVVQWIGVRKGDAVKRDQVVVRLDDAEYRARLIEAEGRLATAHVALERAQLQYKRVHELFEKKVASQDAEDEARLAVAAARAQIQEVEGQRALARTYLDWTVIRSPIDGIVLEKLVEPGELVVPMSFGGGRGPSTALIAVADLNDLQVEIDLNEADLAKISLGHACRVSPEAYPDKHYEGTVAEVAPEANRQKGTLQLKIAVKSPDRHLTPELTAKVEFAR